MFGGMGRLHDGSMVLSQYSYGSCKAVCMKARSWCITTIWGVTGCTVIARGHTDWSDERKEKILRPRGWVFENLKQKQLRPCGQGSRNRNKQTCGQEDGLSKMIAKAPAATKLCNVLYTTHDRHVGRVENVFEKRKKNAHATTQAPAATTSNAPESSIQIAIRIATPVGSMLCALQHYLVHSYDQGIQRLYGRCASVRSVWFDEKQHVSQTKDYTNTPAAMWRGFRDTKSKAPAA